MTHTVLSRPAQLEVPPFEEIHQRQRRGAIVLTAAAAVMGALLIIGAMTWTGLAGVEDTGSADTAAISLESSGSSEDALTTGTETDSGFWDVSEIAASAVDSVVVVDVTIDARGPFDTTASGSGVIIDENGTIVTNAHVTSDATAITVELTDGTVYDATVLVESIENDIAILEIEATGLTAVELGSSEDLIVGEPVIAIGNPLALEGGPSVSAGIVSALDRVLEGSDTTLDGIIQTDAAITEGSSGGALLDADGRLIGITTAVGVSSVGVEGIAFAVPVETVTDVLSSITSA